MTDMRQFVAFTRTARCFSLLLCFAILGGMQQLAAQARTSAKPIAKSNPVVAPITNRDVSATAPHMRSTTNAQRKAAAANAAIRRAAEPVQVKRPMAMGVHTNAIAGQPGGVALTRDQLYFSSIYPNYANSPLPNVADTVNCSAPNYCGIRKFISPLPSLSVAHADTKTFPNTDYYEISLRQYTQKLSSDLPATTLRGYVQTNNGTDTLLGTNTVAPAAIQYLGPLIIAQRDRAVRIKFTNELPTGTTPGAINGTPDATGNGNLFIPDRKSVV